MKRLVLMAVFLMGTGIITSKAQNYDDVYSNGNDQQNARNRDNQSRQQQSQYQSEFSDYNQSGQNQNYNDNSQGTDDYVDYNDDYYYSQNINRFYRPMYNVGYYSPYNNPYWYDRTWVDPYWGYNPFVPSVSIGFGYGPYWSSGWGWSAWYGYPGFSSYWGYPGYACGWYGPYYGGFWNGYYAGFYGGGVYGNRTVAYGPRYSTNTRYNGLGYRAAYANTSYRPFVARTGFNNGTNNYNNVATRGANPGNVNAGSNNTAPGQMARRNFAGAQQTNQGSNYNAARSGNFQSAAPRGGSFTNGGTRSFGGNNGGARPFGGGNNGGGRSFGGGFGGGATHSSGGGGGHTSGGGGHGFGGRR